MNKQQILNELSEALSNFDNVTNALFEKGSTEPVTKGDLFAIADVTSYAFRKVQAAFQAIE